MVFCIKTFALNPLFPPGSNFDLSAWKLQTLDQSLLFTEVSANSLNTGYTSSFFYTDPTDGSIVCKVPSNGATTSGSSYPRVEFRQMTGGANWVLNDPTEHYLTAQCKVLAVAQAKPQTIIGQIHGSNTVSELLKLRWTGYLPKQCFLEARFKTNDASMSEYGVTLATGLSLGDLINYTITMKNGVVTCTVNGVIGTQTYTPDIWTLTDAYYFKAGNYLQYNLNSVTPPDPTVYYGQNQFYKLSLTKITTDIQTVTDKNELNIYPNPAKDKIAINFSATKNSVINLRIYDGNGKLMKQMNAVENQKIDISGLANGIYLAKMSSQSISKTTKLVIIK